MCKHIINAQVSIQTPCCKRWYECSECHDEHEGHPQRIGMVVAFTCKSCKRIFLKDLSIFASEDNSCPHCHKVFVMPAITPEAKVAELALSLLSSEANSIVSSS